MKRRIFLSLVMMIVMSLFTINLFAQFSGGNGTESNPYRIKYVKDLIELSNTNTINDGYYNTYFIMLNDISFKRDIDSSIYFNPIGSKLHPFRGIFDGGYYTIENLTINKNDIELVGLFGMANNSEIRNIGLKNCNFTGSAGVGMIGYLYNSKLKSSYIYSSKIQATYDCIGGLVGINSGDIENCYSDKTTITGLSQIGGLVGMMHGGSIKNSYSASYIYSQSSYKGGIVGYMTDGSIVTNCHYLKGYMIDDDGNLVIMPGAGNKENIGILQTFTSLASFSMASILNNNQNVWKYSYQEHPRLTPLKKFIYDYKHLASVLSESSRSNQTFVLMEDIDLKNMGLHFGSNTLNGTFDGNGHNISYPSNHNYCLFYWVGKNGVIKNLSITNARVYTSRVSESTGILVRENEGTIQNCYIHGVIDTKVNDTYGGRGGIVGYNSGKIESCFTNITINSNMGAGGIAGINTGVIRNCHTNGILNSDYTPNGGIAALNYDEGLIESCVNLIPKIIGEAHRICHSNPVGANYSLNTTLVYDNIVSSGTLYDGNGQNVTDFDLKTESFWSNIGYDFTNTWKMSTPTGFFKGYPIFKWMNEANYKSAVEYLPLIATNCSNQILASLYPNPATTQVTLRIDGLNEDANVVIVDMQGKVVTSFVINQPETTINTSNYAKGTYFVRISNKNINQTQKLIIQ